MQNIAVVPKGHKFKSIKIIKLIFYTPANVSPVMCRAISHLQ